MSRVFREEEPLSDHWLVDQALDSGGGSGGPTGIITSQLGETTAGPGTCDVRSYLKLPAGLSGWYRSAPFTNGVSLGCSGWGRRGLLVITCGKCQFQLCGLLQRYGMDSGKSGFLPS